MLNTPALNKNKIFNIALSENQYLVYAPLANYALIMDTDSVQFLDRYAVDRNVNLPEHLKEDANKLFHIDQKRRYVKKISAPELIDRLFILPTNKCNFSCSYCFSAKGRAGDVLDKDQLRATLAFFIDPERAGTKYLSVSFVGGGEPLTEWELTKFGIEYSAELAKERGVSLNVSLITNGGRITDDMIKTLLINDVAVTVSFEILEEIQNLHRGHFREVSETIQKLIENKVYVRIRSTITPGNVRLQDKMIRELNASYPEIKDVIFEIVTDSALTDPERFRKFHQDFIACFFGAEKIAATHQCKLACTASMNAEKIMERYCPGYFVLTPHGEISLCTRITSPHEKGYDEQIFGKFRNNRLSIDYKKYDDLINDKNEVQNCAGCFASLHCAGGCSGQRYVYTEEQMNIVCDFTREFTKQYILTKLIETN